MSKLKIILWLTSLIFGLSSYCQNSTDFATDIIINNNPQQDQKNTTICSAYNGWLYAAYSYYNNQTSWLSILKSEDHGETWTTFSDEPLPWNHTIYSALKIIVCGDSLTNLKLFKAVCLYDSVTTNHFASVTRFNAVTGEFENSIFNDHSNQIRDISIASDYPYSSNNSDPFSIAVAYSKRNIFDSIIVLTSSNGGYSFDNKQTLAGTGNYFGHVDIAYGLCSSFNNGQYFVVWEEKEQENSTTGNIYTCRSEPDFNSPFTHPIKLDELDPSLVGQLRNPSIACHFGDYNNDSNNISEVILCQRNNELESNFDLTAFYNKNAANGDIFQYSQFVTGVGDQIQPDISFNPYDSTFTATWYDIEFQKLPFATINIDLPGPTIWNVVSEGYNDSPNLLNPEPNIALDYEKKSVVNVWNGLSPGNNGIALLDAPYIYYTKVEDVKTNRSKSVEISPNPAQSTIHVKLPDNMSGVVEISIISSLGQLSEINNREYFFYQNSWTTLDISDLTPGLYICIARKENIICSGNFIVTK